MVEHIHVCVTGEVLRPDPMDVSGHTYEYRVVAIVDHVVTARRWHGIPAKSANRTELYDRAMLEMMDEDADNRELRRQYRKKES